MIDNISRRDVLKTFGMASSGLVLATTFGNSMTVWAQTPAKNDGRLNLFVRVLPDDRVIITVHRSEMGQGIRTGLPQIVADELDADWQKVSVEQAPGDQRYGDQNTDGSNSVRGFYQPMRQMGAAARHMLIMAAAKVWNVPTAECSTELHQVVHKKSGKQLRYGQLADVAASFPAPDVATLTLKKSAAFRYIGKGLSPVDNENFVRGRATFGADVSVPNMVYASIERAPVLGSSVKTVDDSAARKVKGVITVITLPKRPLPVHFKHLPGVAVIANNTWSALQGRQALKIEWSASEHAVHNTEKDLSALREQVKKNGKVIRDTGKGKAALNAAKSQHQAVYTVPYLPHATMEPPSAVARVEGDRCEVWAPAQSPQDVQETLVNEFGFKKENVIVNVTLLGGAFGRKSKPDFVCEAVYLARELKRPVKVQWTRSDDLHHDYFHAFSAQHLQAGLDANGKVDSWVHHAAYPTIASTFSDQAKTAQDWELSLGATDIPFAIANTQCETSDVISHTRIGWLRSVNNIQQAFAIGSFVDELARLTKRDTLSMWMQLLGDDRHHNPAVGDFKYGNYGESLDKFPIDIARYKRALNTVAERAAMSKPLPKGQGWGIAIHRSFVSYVAVATRVSVKDKTVRIEEMHCVADCGQVINPDRVTAQMEGAMIFGLSLTLMGKIDFADGKVVQSNFHDMPLLRINQCPSIHVHLIASDAPPGGVGEPGVPPVAASVCNAIVAAGGERVRDLPVNRVYQV